MNCKDGYTLKPITLREAKKFIDQYHRHNVSPQGHKFSIGLYKGDEMVGVVIVGRPISRHQDDGITAEVTRCCVKEGNKNANSFIYAAAWRAAKAMGYNRMITYTLPTESGSSLRGAGFIKIGVTESKPNGWTVPSRPRKMADKYPTEQKIIWQIQTEKQKE